MWRDTRDKINITIVVKSFFNHCDFSLFSLIDTRILFFCRCFEILIWGEEGQGENRRNSRKLKEISGNFKSCDIF